MIGPPVQMVMFNLNSALLILAGQTYPSSPASGQIMFQ